MYATTHIWLIEDDIRENLERIRLSYSQSAIFRLLYVVRTPIKTLSSWLLYLLEA